jgi:hypothetical protein
MIIKRRQWTRYGMLRYDRDLIGDAEVKLHTVVDLETAKHNARAHKELVSVGAHAARPLRVVKSEFRPEIVHEVVLHGQAAEECRADDVLIVRRERRANRPLDVEITPTDAACDCGGDNPSRSVGKGGNAGWRLKSQKSTENVVSIFFVGAEQPLLTKFPSAKPVAGLTLLPSGSRCSKFGTLIRISLVVVGISSRPLPEK